MWRELGWGWRFVGWNGHTTVEAKYDDSGIIWISS